jgi:hypothetical protein
MASPPPPTLAMCDLCQDILGTLTVPHEKLECPYQASLYCVACGCYGHRRYQCPKDELALQDSRQVLFNWLRANHLKPASQLHRMKKQIATAAFLMNPPCRVVFLPKS